MHTNTDTNTRNARFQASMTAHALERIAATLERMSRKDDSETGAVLDGFACELAHHADALREATGLNDLTAANVAALIANPSTR